ncbi:sugar transferase [Govanella unica]|uniref:Sugar transferase n=1 Tax=Govanella unica TaxID=2975056 RepID=A0A9X3TVU8_9PROT|nr:sugar transferase [Govania unica]MDA5192489.1 sugar transferase [Govania unica]
MLDENQVNWRMGQSQTLDAHADGSSADHPYSMDFSAVSFSKSIKESFSRSIIESAVNTDDMIAPVKDITVAVRAQPLSLRLLDICGALVGLTLSAPFMLIAMLLIWLEDRHNPFYIAERIGAGGKPFRFIKLRSISVRRGVGSDEIITADDPRVTRLGHFIRASKFDELPQFWHVLHGDMSLVGPRANVASIVESFTEEERQIISIKPGITDLASIVFLNLGKVLEGSRDPKLDYNRLVRPWKSRLALLYVRNQSLGLALRTLVLTVVAFVSHPRALEGVARLASHYKTDPRLARIVRREEGLVPYPPPGADKIVNSLSGRM